jgi:hypothetical protein
MRAIVQFGRLVTGSSSKATPKDYRFRSVLLARSYSSIPDGMCHP